MGTAVIEEDVVRAPRVMAGAAFAQPGVTAPQRAASRQAITEVPSSGRRRGLTKRHAVKTVAAAGTNDRGRVSDPPAGPEEGTQWKKSNEWFFTERGIKQWVKAMELDNLTPDMPHLIADMGIHYDPAKLAAELKKRPTDVSARAVFVASRLGGFIASLLRDVATGSIERNMRERARELRATLAELGPSFIKIGQALSSRPDLVPRVYLEELSELQDRLPPFSSTIAREVIREELGADPETLFAELSPEPVAAASLGQVYRGRLRTGEAVAVKVQRPGIGESIAVDMLLLRRLMQVVDSTLTPQLGIAQPLTPLVDEFADKLFKEMDYVMEGRNCERFRELYCTPALPRVGTPSIYWDFTSRRVLTMEWIEGVKLTDKEGMRRLGLSVVDFVDVGIECTLRQLLEAGYFHADPHPGNLLATRDGRLVYLDFGMMSEAPERARYALIAHVVHLVNRDYMAMTQDYYALDFIEPGVDTTPIAPALAAFFDDVLQDSVSKLNFKAIVDGLGDVLFQFPFKVPAYYALILRSLTVLEGLALSADPDYKLLAKAYPYMAKRLLTDPNPQLRRSLEDMLVKDGSFRWSRLENLLKEGAKSSDYDAEQLWLLAEWVLGDRKNGVRKPLVREAIKILDAYIADAWRQQAAATYGAALAERLLPRQPHERADRDRAQLLIDTLTARLASPPPRGSGPMGTLTPAEAASFLTETRERAMATFPRLDRVLRSPGAVEAINELSTGLASRGAARFVKLLMQGMDPAVQERMAQGVGVGAAGGPFSPATSSPGMWTPPQGTNPFSSPNLFTSNPFTSPMHWANPGNTNANTAAQSHSPFSWLGGAGFAEGGCGGEGVREWWRGAGDMSGKSNSQGSPSGAGRNARTGDASASASASASSSTAGNTTSNNSTNTCSGAGTSNSNASSHASNGWGFFESPAPHPWSPWAGRPNYGAPGTMGEAGPLTQALGLAAFGASAAAEAAQAASAALQSLAMAAEGVEMGRQGGVGGVGDVGGGAVGVGVADAGKASAAAGVVNGAAGVGAKGVAGAVAVGAAAEVSRVPNNQHDTKSSAGVSTTTTSTTVTVTDKIDSSVVESNSSGPGQGQERRRRGGAVGGKGSKRAWVRRRGGGGAKRGGGGGSASGGEVGVKRGGGGGNGGGGVGGGAGLKRGGGEEGVGGDA